jgi:hypothetical protein
MRRTTWKNPLIMLGTAGFALALSSCGNATETGIEQLIESQGGGDVDLDLDGTAASRSRPRTGDDRRRGRQLRGHRRRRVRRHRWRRSPRPARSSSRARTAASAVDPPPSFPRSGRLTCPEPDGFVDRHGNGDRLRHRTGDHGGRHGQRRVRSSTATPRARVGRLRRRTSSFTSDGNINNNYENDPWTVNVSFFGEREREPGHRHDLRQQLTRPNSRCGQPLTATPAPRPRPPADTRRRPRCAATGARSRFASSSCFAGGLTIASRFPTNSAPPNANVSQARRSSPRNIPQDAASYARSVPRGGLLAEIRNPAQLVVGAFSVFILFGTALLWLPISADGPGHIGLEDALFTSTSASR